MHKKNVEKDFSCCDNSIWIGCVNLSVLRREYLESDINMLKNSLKILHFIWRRETFSKSIAFTLINKYGKGAFIQISTYLGPFTMLLFEGSSETRLFRHWSNQVFLGP